MSSYFTDARPEAEAVLIQLARQAPSWQKFQMMGQLNKTARTLMMSGLRARYSAASDAELRRRLADLVLGKELALKVYGPLNESGKARLIVENEALTVTLEVIDVLEQLKIPHLIGGSLASTLHGFARTTLDSDLVADIHPAHVPSLVQRLGDRYYISDTSIYDAIRHRSSFNLIHLATMFKVDIFLPKARQFDRDQMRHTILAKLEWYRLGGEVSDRQWRDILGVIQIQGDRLDLHYLRQGATGLGVADLLQRALTGTDPTTPQSPQLPLDL